ncbi:Isochorismatase domain-containing protein 2 [Chelonia mydas]|uniref:Isochorismatase domain-containing protein 2 n=1 Tax=Chelonia mydas TaxID=8469 RepID=M7B9E4_CHEMY|nr:Isochorismatase domain-containing protein 2 [Chelonia mydas]
MALPLLGKVFPKTSILFLCDMQEKFRPNIAHFPQIVAVAARMLQCPQGLGPTVPELGAEGLKKFPKTCFSMLVPEVEQELGALPHLRSVLLCGIETQACIMSTALDALERGLDVHVVADACSSRSQPVSALGLDGSRRPQRQGMGCGARGLSISLASHALFEPLLSPERLHQGTGPFQELRLGHQKALSQTNICATGTPLLERHQGHKMNSHPSSANSAQAAWEVGSNHTANRRQGFGVRRQSTIEQLQFIPGHHPSQHLRTGSKNEVTV